MDSICRFVTDDDKALEITPLRFVYETELKKFHQPLYTESFKFMVVSDGAATLFYKGKTFSLVKGSLCFFEQRSTFHLNMDDRFRVIYLDFTSSGLNEYLKSKQAILENPVFYGQDFLLSFFTDAIKMVRNYNASAIMTSSALYALSSIIFSTKEDFLNGCNG